MNAIKKECLQRTVAWKSERIKPFFETFLLIVCKVTSKHLIYFSLEPMQNKTPNLHLRQRNKGLKIVLVC